MVEDACDTPRIMPAPQKKINNLFKMSIQFFFLYEVLLFIRALMFIQNLTSSLFEGDTPQMKRTVKTFIFRVKLRNLGHNIELSLRTYSENNFTKFNFSSNVFFLRDWSVTAGAFYLTIFFPCE